METQKQALLKQFSLLLRHRSKNENEKNEISPQLAKFYSRKALIEIIREKHKGNLPKEHHLLEMENEELLQLIGDDLYLIAYSTQKWAKELAEKKVEKKKEEATKAIKPKSDSPSVKSTANAKTTKDEKVYQSK